MIIAAGAIIGRLKSLMDINPDEFNTDSEGRPDLLSYYSLEINGLDDIVDIEVLLTESEIVIEVDRSSTNLPLLIRVEALEAAVDYIMEKINEQIEEPFDYKIKGHIGKITQGIDIEFQLDDLSWATSTHLLSLQQDTIKYVCVRNKVRSRVINNYKQTYITCLIASSLLSQVVQQLKG